MLPKLNILAIASCATLLVACVHTPPGTSVELALAKVPAVVKAAPTAFPPLPPDGATASRTPGGSHVFIPAVEPLLPASDVHERVTEATSRADFLLQTGNEPEAIAAYEEAVQIDPSQPVVWQTLAELYEKNGNTQKATEAANRSKKLARH